MMLRTRLRSQRPILAAVAGVVAVSAGLGAGLGVITQTAVADGAGAIIADARGGDAVVRVAIRWAGQGATEGQDVARAARDQDAAVRESLERLMPSASLEPAVSIRSEPIEATIVPTTGVTDAAVPLAADLVLISDDTLLDRAIVTDGSWPTARGEAALAAVAADTLGVGIGDLLALPGADERVVSVRITALWQPLDSGDPLWAGDPLIARGLDGSTAGPLVIDQRAWNTIDTRPIAQWVAPLDPDRATPDALAQLAAGLPQLASTIDDDPRSQGTGIVVDGGLEATVAEVRTAAAGVEAIIPSVLALIAVASLTTLLELQRLLASVRRDETTLLRSRGASPRRIVGYVAGEALIVALPAAVLGGALGTVIGFAVRSGSLDRVSDIGGAPLIVSALWALAVAVVTLLLAVLVTASDVRAALRRDTLADSGRATRVVSATALVLCLLAVGVAVGQFVLYRGPVVPTADGGSAVDPVAALAPVLMLLGGALLAVLVVEPLARLAARAAARHDGLRPVLVTRPLARSAVLVTTPVLLVTLGVGGLVVAAAVDATTRASSTAARELALGAPLTISGGVLDGAAGDAFASGAITLGGQSWSVIPVAVTAVTIADAPATLVALDAATSPSIVASAGGAVEPARLATAITTAPLPSLDIPPSAVALRLADAALRADLWVVDARGRVTRLDSDSAGTTPLPATGGPWRVLALDVRSSETDSDVIGTELDLVPNGLIATASDGSEIRIPVGEAWQARPEIIDRPGTVRVMPDPVPLRLAVTAAVAERVGAEVGDTITVTVPSTARRVEGVVADIVRAVPGASTAGAIAVDLASSVQRQLAESANPPTVSAFWFSPDDAASREQATLRSAAAELGEAAPRGTIVAAAVDSASGALADGARRALWTAAVGALLLAIAAVAIVSRAIGGTRSIDVVVLRAIGVGARVQGRARALELGSLLAAAVLAGLAVGAATSAVLVPDLARTLLVDAPLALSLDAAVGPAVALGLVLALSAAVGLLAIDAGRRAARQTLTLSAREVLR